MSSPRSRRFCLIAALAIPLALSACSSQPDPRYPEVKPGVMPDDGDWSGVYYSQIYGYLHLTSDGSTATGAWRTTAGDAYGELNGDIEGNLLTYEWSERLVGSIGANLDRKGKGYFFYKIPKEGEAHELVGEWGLGDQNGGNEWKAVKQKNMEPKPESVRPDEVEGRVPGANDWDAGTPSDSEVFEKEPE